MTQARPLKVHSAKLTPVTNTNPDVVKVDDATRLREIRALVEANNQSTMSTDVIVCQIYMESRFDKDAHPQGSSARGLMQLLKAPVRELTRLQNLGRPPKERRSEVELYREADKFHDSPEFVDEATNIRTGTAYLQALIKKNGAAGASDPVVEAYKDYRGIRNGSYYNKIKAAAEKLSQNPDSMKVLREMVK